MTTLVPYLNFPGNCKEAMTFYQQVFGGQLTVSTFGEYGAEGMPADGTMHAQLVTDSFTIMASDAMPGAQQTWGGTRIYCALVGDDLEAATAWFDRLAEGGHIGVQLERQVWGDAYGLVMDRYGIEWMVNVSVPEAAAGGAPEA